MPSASATRRTALPERSNEVIEQFADRALSEDGMLARLIACMLQRRARKADGR